MERIENQNIEFKQEYVSEIRKEAVAFANSDGGIIRIGIRKDGIVLGISDPDAVMVQAANSLKDSIAPDIMPFVSIQALELDGKVIVEIQIAPGTNRPYYIREKGLRPSGVYVRKGSSSQPVTDEGIREMIIQTDGRSFECMRSLNQELTFHVLEAELQRRGISFGTMQMHTLKLLGEDGLYTNLAMLLSDQCEISMKAAVFNGTDKTVFRDRKEFHGSVLQQIEEAYAFLDLNNKTKAFFQGLNRIDKRDYSEEAVREALLNSVVHRDYSFSGSNLINIYDDRIEFVSIGGLISGLELKSIFLGASRTRNPNLAGLFYRMSLVESYGTGVGTIMRAYSREENLPEFETAQGVFRVTLPNRNERRDCADQYLRERIRASEIAGLHYLKDSGNHAWCEMSGGEGNVTIRSGVAGERQGQQETQILDYAREHGCITRKEAEELLSCGTTKAYHLLQKLCGEEKLTADGNGRLRTYCLQHR